MAICGLVSGEAKMIVSSLDHWSIASKRLEDSRKFYEDILGLEAGFRPKLKSTGYWMYAGDKAIIHLVKDESEDLDGTPLPEGQGTREDMEDSGIDNHIAFTIEDADEVLNLLKDRNIGYWDRDLSDRGLYQIFIKDPNGVILELNYYSA